MLRLYFSAEDNIADFSLILSITLLKIIKIYYILYYFILCNTIFNLFKTTLLKKTGSILLGITTGKKADQYKKICKEYPATMNIAHHIWTRELTKNLP